MKLKISAILCSLLFGCQLASASIAYVNSAHTHCSSLAGGSACTVSYTPTNANDLLVIYAVADGVSAQTLSSITDTDGTPSTALAYAVYTHSATYAGVALYYEAAAASGAHSIAVTFSATASPTVFVAEFSGVATSSPFDAATAVNYSASTTATSATLTPAGDNELVLGFANAAAAGVTFSAWSSGLVEQDSYSATYPSSAWSYVVQTTAAAATSNYTLSGSNVWTSFAVAFKSAGGSSCTHAGITEAGAFAVPVAGTTVMRLQNGSFGTVDCSTVSYRFQNGAFGTGAPAATLLTDDAGVNVLTDDAGANTLTP